MRRIVFTSHDGGVEVFCPTPEMFKVLGSGGFWASLPRGFLQGEIDKQVAHGRPADVTHRFIHALAFGGLSTPEIYRLIRDRDCAHRGTAHDLMDFEDLPDRWFRSAWRRSHNGGPITIDLRKARPIQFQHIKAAIEQENKRRENELERFDDLLDINLASLRDKIHAASDATDLRRIWPEDLDVI